MTAGRVESRVRRLGLSASGALLAVLVAACGASGEQGGGSYAVVKQATDPETGMTFRLEGETLEVALPPGAPRHSERLLKGRIRFFCGPPKYYATPYAPVPQKTGSFPPGARRVTVQLGGLGGVSRDAGFCAMEGPRGDAFGLFMPASKLLCAVAHERAEGTPEGVAKANATCRELERRPPDPGIAR